MFWKAKKEVSVPESQSTVGPIVDSISDSTWSIGVDGDPAPDGRDIRLKFCRNDQGAWITEFMELLFEKMHDGDRVVIDFTDGGPKR